MSGASVGRRKLLGSGVKSIAVGAAAGVLASPILSNSATAGGICSTFTKERYLEYLAAFNRDGSKGDTSGDFARFYTEDILFERGQNHTMRGIKPIVEYYREMFQHVRQELKLLHFAASENFVASEVESRFTVLKDWSHASGVFLRKGREFSSNDFMHYTLRDGLISHVRFANFRRFSVNKEK